MRLFPRLAAGLIAIASVPLHATEVRVVVGDRSPGARCSQDASVVATARTAAVAPVRIAIAESTTLELSDRESWDVRAVKDGCWSTTAPWTWTAAPLVKVEMFAAATLRGTLTVQAGEVPRALRGSLYRMTAPAAAPLATEPEPIACSLTFPDWECGIPAHVPADVRLEAEGFAPWYVWDVTAEPGEVRAIGSRELVAGSSVAGWVQDVDGDPLDGAEVTLAILQPEHAQANRASAGRHTVKTNARGFFQFAGIPPGEYRLASRAAGYAPAVVPALTVRPDMTITWPRALMHAAPVALTVSIDPMSNSDGSPWSVRVTETLPLIPGEPPGSVTFAPAGDGTWLASGLRPDRYQLTVTDRSGSVVETREVDLSTGAGTLVLSLHPIDVTGVVTVGDEPLPDVEVRFRNEDGKTVLVRSGENGRFEAAFPAPGSWTTIVYPDGRTRSTQIRGEVVEIPPDTKTTTIEVALPGGRLRGNVQRDGMPVKAAVHVVRGNAMVAQELTGNDGEFDFIGLPEGTYSVAAEGDAGASARPVEAEVRDDETTEVQLEVEALRVIRATVTTPAGQPASGAIARISIDGGVHWSEVILGVEGTLEYHVPGGVTSVDLIVVTYSYPAATARVTLGNGPVRPLNLTLPAQGGKVRVKPDRAWIAGDTIVAPVNAFYLPASGGFVPVAHLETGSYAVCAEPRVTKTCRRLLVAPGTSTVVELGAGE